MILVPAMSHPVTIAVLGEHGPAGLPLDLGGLDVRAYASVIAQRLPRPGRPTMEETIVEQGQR